MFSSPVLVSLSRGQCISSELGNKVKIDMDEIDYMMQIKNLFDVRWGLIDYAIHQDSIDWAVCP
jgi:hypothetical protein